MLRNISHIDCSAATWLSNEGYSILVGLRSTFHIASPVRLLPRGSGGFRVCWFIREALRIDPI